MSFGSNGSDPVPKKAYANVFKAFTKKTGIEVSVNTVDHNTFQEQINTYLQGQPQDVFTWFAGYRMQFFASKGLLAPIDDVWAPLKPQFASAFQNASKGADGHYYFVPDLRLPVGGALPQERVRSSTATRSRRPGTSSSRSPRR